MEGDNYNLDKEVKIPLDNMGWCTSNTVSYNIAIQKMKSIILLYSLE